MPDDVNKGGAPQGNSNARRGTDVRDALRRSICKLGQKVKDTYLEEHGEEYPDDGQTNYERGLELVSDDMVVGDRDKREVFKEVADRLDGKAVQAVELTGSDGGPVGVTFKMEFPDGGDDTAADPT